MGSSQEEGLNKTSHRQKVRTSLLRLRYCFLHQARDLTGLSDMKLEVSPGTTAGDCLDKLVAKYPGLKELRGCMVLALNEEYTSESELVKSRDELAIIPP